ncbi:MAG: MoaD/ThiS family protein [Thermoplasmata archaeon]|jgi:molybdopterin converting factor small subunit
MPGRVTVRLFATARVAVGASQLRIRVDPDGVTAKSLIDSLGKHYPKLAPALRTSRFVLNERYLTRLTNKVRPGDEFAVHPPYGGG